MIYNFSINITVKVQDSVSIVPIMISITPEKLKQLILGLDMPDRIKFLDELREKMCLRCGGNDSERKCLCDYMGSNY